MISKVKENCCPKRLNLLDSMLRTCCLSKTGGVKLPYEFFGEGVMFLFYNSSCSSADM